MKEIGIKLADGSFYPIMEDGSPCNKNLVLTTVKDNQTRVIVDMYRSKTGTMEDAEYIDSLQIDNLVAHPHGSVELSLNIGLDADNKLSASMNDPETGGSSSANITLVSRTLEERLEPTNYEVVGAKSAPDATESGTDFELPEESFSADDAVVENETDFELPDEITDDEIMIEEPPVTDGSASGENEIPAGAESSVPDAAVSETANRSSGEEQSDRTAKIAGAAVAGAAAGGLLAKVLAKQEAERAETSAEEKKTNFSSGELSASEADAEAGSAFAEESTQVSSGLSAASPVTNELPDFSADETVSGDVTATEDETVSPADAEFSEDEFAPPSEEPSFGAETVSAESAETFSAESFAESPADSSDGFDFDLPDFTDDGETPEESAPVPADSPVTDELPDFSADETVSGDVTATEDETVSPADAEFSEDESAPLSEEPSFGAETVSAESAETSSAEPFAESPADSSDGFDFDLPDFTDSPETDSAEGGGVFSDEMNQNGAEKDGDMFTDDDLNFDSDGNSGSSDFGISDDDFAQTGAEAGTYVKDATPSSGIVFDGLYDKETAEGNSSASEEDSVEKKTKVPVIICVVCAIICVLATLLVLFVVPSKYNLLNKHSDVQEETAVVSERIEESLESLPEEEPLPLPVEAKEEEIVVVTEPETVEAVVPEPPAEPETKPADIVYKIKWGDTLWDIADAYYKNPWRYHMIASYNHIKDPDYIISGTTIVLPAK